MIHFSAATRGFYHADLHGELPADAVEISAARHRQLLDAQARGRAIVASEGGRPMLAPIATPHVDQLRARTIAAVKREARRRILAIASLERQINDVAALAIAAAAGELLPADALTRRERIDAIRTASDSIEAAIATMHRDELAAVGPAADPRWPAA